MVRIYSYLTNNMDSIFPLAWPSLMQLHKVLAKSVRTETSITLKFLLLCQSYLLLLILQDN